MVTHFYLYYIFLYLLHIKQVSRRSTTKFSDPGTQYVFLFIWTIVKTFQIKMLLFACGIYVYEFNIPVTNVSAFSLPFKFLFIHLFYHFYLVSSSGEESCSFIYVDFLSQSHQILLLILIFLIRYPEFFYMYISFVNKGKIFSEINFGVNCINLLLMMVQLYSDILNNKVGKRGIHDLFLIFIESFCGIHT